MVSTIQFLRDMIAIPSVNPMTTNSGAPVERAMGNFIETMLARAGIDCERQRVADGRDNVVGIVHANGGNRAGGVMLNSHMDTVPIDNMLINPFDPIIKTIVFTGASLGDARQHECGDAAALEGVNYGTDGSKLARAGIQTVICGPGDIAQAHTDSEFVEIDQVELAARVYGHLLSNWARLEQ